MGPSRCVVLLSPSRGACFKKAPPDAYVRNALKADRDGERGNFGKNRNNERKEGSGIRH